MISSLGKPKDQKKGPSDKMIQTCRTLICEALGIDPNMPDGLTELKAPLIKAWVKAADDPDKAVAEWLCTGAPTGIDLEIPMMGIFPPTIEPPSK